jgi:Ca2+-dependent lipid-binding protein
VSDSKQWYDFFLNSAVRGANLAAKDANGLSDPYLIIELFVGTENNGEWSVSKTMNKTTTPVIKETLNPEWNFGAILL